MRTYRRKRNNSLRPKKPERSEGRKTEDGYRTDTHADGSDGHREVRC